MSGRDDNEEGTEPLLSFDKTILDAKPTIPFGAPAPTRPEDERTTGEELHGSGFANTSRLKPSGQGQDATTGLNHGHGEDKGDLQRRIIATMEASDAKSRPDPLLGMEIGGRFNVESKIGEGGMGAVYRARQKGMDRDVAIKVLLKQMTDNATVKRRFTLEALAVSKLKHPNTIQIFDFGETPHGELYIAMEFLEGEALQDRLRERGAIPVSSALKIAAQMTKSLREAHGKGIVHRDLKPDNIFLTTVGEETDFVKVLDFGVAKLRENDENQATLTKAGAVFGTPRYMSPEQGASSGTVDQRSDLYAIGVILYEMCTGRAPFDADSALGILIQHMQEPVPAMVSVRPDLVVPEPVEAFILRLLEKKPEDRPATAEAVIRQLETLLRGLDDVYRRVVTSDYAEAVGLEVQRARPTQADTRLNTGAGQALLDTAVASAPTMYEGGLPAKRRGKLGLIAAAALVLVLGAAGVVYAMIGPLPGSATDGSGELVVLDTRQGSLPEATPLPDLDVVSVRIDSAPRGAKVFGPQGELGTTPYLAARLKNADRAMTFRVEKDGFQTASYVANFGKDVDTLLQLKPNELKVVTPEVTPPAAKPATAKRPKVTKSAKKKPAKVTKPAAKVTKPAAKVTKPVVKKTKKPFGFGPKVDDIK